ncbi:MAG: S1 family peptidase [Chloroflexota bacterium]
MHNLVRCSVAAALAIVVSTTSVSAETVRPLPANQTEQYAKDMEVSLNEATSRLELQDAVGVLNAKLAEQETETFAGMWIEHEPAYRIVVQFTENGEQTIQPYIENSSLKDFVEVQHADSSYAELVETQLDAIEMLDRQQLAFDADINIEEGKVDIYVTEQTTDKVETLIGEAAKEADQASIDTNDEQDNAELLDIIEINTVDQLSRSTQSTSYAFGGGEATECTTGFLVRDGNGTYGLTTAGHCPDTQNFLGNNIPFVAGSDSGSYDLQWHTIGSLTPSATINKSTDYTQWESITGTVSRSAQPNGTYVCKYGKTTGLTCGLVNSNSVRPNYIKDAAPTFMRVKTTDGSRMTLGGDSGGPYFLNGKAYGIQSGDGGLMLDEAVYMAVDYFADFGISIVTQ